MDIFWDIFWKAIGTLVGIAALIFSILNFVAPMLQRHKWGKILPQIIAIKEKAINLQNDNWKDLSSEEISKFTEEVGAVHKELLDEIAKVSKTKSERYEYFGLVNISPFLDINDREQRKHLGIITRCWQICDEIIDKYS